LHPFCNGQSSHLILDSDLVPKVFLAALLLLFIFLPLLLVDLLLESLPHGLLLSFSLILYNELLIPTLSQNVAISFQLKIYSILQNTSPQLHFREVSLGDAGVKSLLVYSILGVLSIVCIVALDIKGLVVILFISDRHLPLERRWVGVVLALERLAHCHWFFFSLLGELSGSHLPPLLLSSVEVTLFNLFFKLVSEDLLLQLLLKALVFRL